VIIGMIARKVTIIMNYEAVRNVALVQKVHVGTACTAVWTAPLLACLLSR
jgi:hypothetical protein